MVTNHKQSTVHVRNCCGALNCRGNPLDVLAGKAKSGIHAARVIGLGEEQLTVMGSKCLKVEVQGGSTGSVIVRLSSCEHPQPHPRR